MKQMFSNCSADSIDATAFFLSVCVNQFPVELDGLSENLEVRHYMTVAS